MPVCPLKSAEVGAMRVAITAACNPDCAWFVPEKGCAITVIAAALTDQKKS